MLGLFFVAGIHPSRTWTSGSFESVRWNACMHRLDLRLYSHPKEFWGMESEPMLTPREKSPLMEHFSSEEDWTQDAASSRTVSPTHYQRANPFPLDWFNTFIHNVPSSRRSPCKPNRTMQTASINDEQTMRSLVILLEHVTSRKSETKTWMVRTKRQTQPAATPPQRPYNISTTHPRKAEWISQKYNQKRQQNMTWVAMQTVWGVCYVGLVQEAGVISLVYGRANKIKLR